MAEQGIIDRLRSQVDTWWNDRRPVTEGHQETARETGVMLGLKALSQGAAIALGNVASHVFSLITVAMVFWVWTTIPDPNNYQLISLALFGLFILAANVIVRRK